MGSILGDDGARRDICSGGRWGAGDGDTGGSGAVGLRCWGAAPVQGARGAIHFREWRGAAGRGGYYGQNMK